jgi:2-polyprenyl-6-methoxyphenol hydroxylase-like FAD-dependent oxidoreductase
MADSEPFKVIIIGGGPTGLALAHMLHLAGIDYRLYDKREDLCERRGAGLAIQPQNCRILDQLGILDQALQQGLAPEMQVHREVGADGKILAEYPFFQWLKENHGHTMLLFERWQYIKLLYDTLPHCQNHVLTGKTLQSLAPISDARVSVRFTDGSEDKASIVIGADGVYSKVRECIIQNAPKPILSHKPYRISFRALYGVGPLPEGMDPGVVREIPHKGWWFQIISQPQRIFWMLYQALDPSVDQPIFYGVNEAEALAAEYADCPVGEGFAFKHLRASKTFEKLAVLEEGVAARWYWKRVVLIGDSVHKVVITRIPVFHEINRLKPT